MYIIKGHTISTLLANRWGIIKTRFLNYRFQTVHLPCIQNQLLGLYGKWIYWLRLTILNKHFIYTYDVKDYKNNFATKNKTNLNNTLYSR